MQDDSLFRLLNDDDDADDDVVAVVSCGALIVHKCTIYIYNFINNFVSKLS